MLSEEISQKLLSAPQIASGILLKSRALPLEDGHTWLYGTLLVNIIQIFHMVTPSAQPCMGLDIHVNCDLILDRQKSKSLVLLRDLFETVWWAGSMVDPQPSALPLQLHGNSFAMSSGQVPKLSAGYNEGGGGQDAVLHQQTMTSSARVSCRLNPGEQFGCPLEPLVHCHAKGRLDMKSRSCSLLTICRSGVIFPWMNQRTADSEQSGNSAFLYCHLLF